MISKLKEPIFDYDGYLVWLKKESLRNQICFQAIHPFDEEPFRKWILDHYPVSVRKPNSLYNLVRQMSEDVCIMHKDRLVWMFVCFPSNWKPEEKIGKSFAQLHEPVPEKIAKLPYKGNFERTVWGLGRSYNRHPRFPIEHNFITRERQVMIGFGDSVLFIIRQYIEPITPEGLAKLPTDPAMRRYKGLLR